MNLTYKKSQRILILFLICSLFSLSLIMLNLENLSLSNDTHEITIYQAVPASPSPINATQPNGYEFSFYLSGDESGHYCYYRNEPFKDGRIISHPILEIDEWWYFGYWNEVKCIESTIGGPMGHYWRPILVSTGLKIGDPLPDQVFNLTQYDGRSFQARLNGTLENPFWETITGKRIFQEVLTLNGVSKGVWHYIETSFPVNEYGNELKPFIDNNSDVIFILLLILPLFSFGVALLFFLRKKQ